VPLGGTAFAVGSKQFASQPRCAPGAVRAAAIVTGQRIDLSGLTSSWTSNPSLFDYRWSCTGGGVLVRKAPDSTAAADVKFVGNPSRVAIDSDGRERNSLRRLGQPAAGRVVPRRLWRRERRHGAGSVAAAVERALR